MATRFIDPFAGYNPRQFQGFPGAYGGGAILPSAMIAPQIGQGIGSIADAIKELARMKFDRETNLEAMNERARLEQSLLSMRQEFEKSDRSAERQHELALENERSSNQYNNLAKMFGLQREASKEDYLTQRKDTVFDQLVAEGLARIGRQEEGAAASIAQAEAQRQAMGTPAGKALERYKEFSGKYGSVEGLKSFVESRDYGFGMPLTQLQNMGSFQLSGKDFETEVFNVFDRMDLQMKNDGVPEDIRMSALKKLIGDMRVASTDSYFNDTQAAGHAGGIPILGALAGGPLSSWFGGSIDKAEKRLSERYANWGSSAPIDLHRMDFESRLDRDPRIASLAKEYRERGPEKLKEFYDSAGDVFWRTNPDYARKLGLPEPAWMRKDVPPPPVISAPPPVQPPPVDLGVLEEDFNLIPPAQNGEYGEFMGGQSYMRSRMAPLYEVINQYRRGYA